MVATRGSWTLDEAIIRRWEEDGLDALFRAEWPDPAATEYNPFNDGEARPTPPGPYCVYEKQTPLIDEHHTGKTDTTANQVQQITVQFTIHAKSNATSSGKERAQALAEFVAAAFDPGRDKLDISPDSHITTIRGPDFHIREGDEEWAWVLQFDFYIDAEYDAQTS